MPKKIKDTAIVPGWTYTEIKPNFYLPCMVCGKLDHEMYYRSIREPGASYSTTEAKCQECVIK